MIAVAEELAALRAEVQHFVAERILPAEAQIMAEDANANGDLLAIPSLVRLRAEAKAAGLWTPHLPAAYGGRGLGVMGMCVLFREMGRSPVGAAVFGCDAPDQGNADLLVRIGSEAQRARWLAPLAAGQITSAFCMTEPAPGAGADPRNLRSAAVADGDGRWRLDGHKWYTTGGGAASFYVVMARTSADANHGATLFLVPRDRPGVVHVRDFSTMGEPMLTHREAEMRFVDVALSDDDVIGGVGQGFALAQLRLVPARLTHCMRWLGLATRALEMCRAYLGERVSFGRPLADHQLVQKMIADSAIAIHAGNLMTLHCATVLERGDVNAARGYSSMAKYHVANTLCDVLDRAIQMHGGLGYSDDLPFARWYRFARAARIADGPDEVHIGVVARDVLRGRLDVLV